jgi:hypothetical protein
MGNLIINQINNIIGNNNIIKKEDNNIIKLDNNISLGIYTDENNKEYQGICFKKINKRKVIFGISFTNYNMIDLYFENNVRLLLNKNDNNINIEYSDKNNSIKYNNLIKIESLKNLKKISNNSDDIDLIYNLINKN